MFPDPEPIFETRAAGAIRQPFVSDWWGVFEIACSSKIWNGSNISNAARMLIY